MSYYAIVFSLTYLFDCNANPIYRKYIQAINTERNACCIHLKTSLPWHIEIINNIKYMYELSQQNIEHWNLSMLGLFYCTWQLMYNNCFTHITIPSSIIAMTPQMELVTNYIHLNFNKEITLVDLCQISNYSQTQFCRYFKQFTHYSPFTYIKRYRILKSCEYLAYSTKKITEIATLCGFNNISYFNREFINIIKVSPTSYRKNIKNKS